MAEKAVVTHNYDPDIAALAVDANCDKLVQSLDPVSVAPKLVSRGLISSQQAQDILDDRVKTRAERNLTFLNLIKSSPDSTWFSSLLEAIGEDKTTERLKEVLEKSYRAVELERRHGLSHASPITLNSMPVSSRKGKSSSSQPPAKRSKQSVTDVTATQEPPSLSSRKGKSSSSRPSAKRPRRSLRLQQKQLSSSESPATQPQQSATDVTATQELPSLSSRKGKSSSSQPPAKRSRWSVTDVTATQEPPSRQSSQSTSSVSLAANKHLWSVRHPLEVEFLRLKDILVEIFEKTHQPTVKKLRECCSYLVKTGNEAQPKIAQELERAKSYAEVMEIVFLQLCRWLHFSFLEMIVDYCSLKSMHASLQQYKMKLRPVLQKKFDRTEEALKEAKVTKDIPPDGMRQIIVTYNLDAGGITLEDVASYRQFLSSILEIPHHLLVLISVLYGSLLLELWIPEELTPQAVRRVEEVWRELWRRKVEGIEVGDRSFDLLQQSNTEKAALIGASLSVVVVGEQWKLILLSCGTRLYEEYGRHESLQSCVRKHKEAGRPSPEALGALEWLLLHHTPEVAEREGKDPLNVLLTTLYLGCCDVEEFVQAVARCLEGDPAVGKRLQEASMELKEFVHRRLLTSESFQPQEVFITQLPDEAVTKLYLKYSHLPSLQDSISPGVKDPQHLSHEEMEKVKKWFQGHMTELEERGVLDYPLLYLSLALVEAGVTELGPCPSVTKRYFKRLQARQLSEMEKSFPHSQEDVRAIQASFQMYLVHLHQAISPDDLLQAANSQRKDIYQLFFEALEEQKVDLEPLKSYLGGKVPPYYQQDLEQAFTPSADAVAMETSTTLKGKQVSGPTLVSATGSSSADSSHSSHLAEVKRQFQLQVAEVFPLFSSAPKMKALSEELARTPLFMEQDSSDTLMSAEDSSAITRQFLKLWSWYEVSLLKLVTGVLLDSRALEELNQFVRSRDDSLQHTSLPECFPQGPLMANQLAPPPGYTSLRLTLPSHPEDVPMGRLWSLKEQLCSSLTLQSYALLLKGYMEGSTHIIFHISQHVTLDEDRVAAMFEGAKRAGLYPHSITTALGTAQEVEYRLLDMLPLIKRRKVSGQMEGLTVAEREHQLSATDTAQQ